MSSTTQTPPPILPDGILLVDKPAGMTSHDVVNRIRRLFGTKKVGHTGTLDPMATGVLVILIGRAAKASEYVSHDAKTYEATLRLGLRTDTEDTSGTVLTEAPLDTLPTPAELLAVLDRFRGEILQIPPMYSALKVGGRKLCDIARAGATIDRPPRPVTIHTLTATPIPPAMSTDPAPLSSEFVASADSAPVTDYRLHVRCSGGTYIRTLCADIGEALGVGGVMAALRRVEACSFPITACHTLSKLEDMPLEARCDLLLPVEQLFSDCPALPLPAFYHTLCRNGCEIYQRKIGTDYPVGTRLRLLSPDGTFFALGEVMAFEAGTAVKAVKIFVLEEA